ncbi:MAG TPA: hypothetical protein VLO11_08010, partial [Luteolibacter sp.]|nr:hypothetical protein [Luteolibacter sp.]
MNRGRAIQFLLARLAAHENVAMHAADAPVLHFLHPARERRFAGVIGMLYPPGPRVGLSLQVFGGGIELLVNG